MTKTTKIVMSYILILSALITQWLFLYMISGGTFNVISVNLSKLGAFIRSLVYIYTIYISIKIFLDLNKFDLIASVAFALFYGILSFLLVNL